MLISSCRSNVNTICLVGVCSTNYQELPNTAISTRAAVSLEAWVCKHRVVCHLTEMTLPKDLLGGPLYRTTLPINLSDLQDRDSLLVMRWIRAWYETYGLCVSFMVEILTKRRILTLSRGDTDRCRLSFALESIYTSSSFSCTSTGLSNDRVCLSSVSNRWRYYHAWFLMSFVVTQIHWTQEISWVYFVSPVKGD